MCKELWEPKGINSQIKTLKENLGVWVGVHQVTKPSFTKLSSYKKYDISKKCQVILYELRIVLKQHDTG